MRDLHIDPDVSFVLPDAPLTICVCGCGGTGSHLAQTLARIAAHQRDRRKGKVHLIFVDGDTVEQRNVGRQLFSESDIGRNKAQALAARFNAVWGLRIEAVPAMATTDLLTTLVPTNGIGILVGAVDSGAARQVLRNMLIPPFTNGPHRWAVWIDCGNEEHAGQVLVGSEGRCQALHGAFALGSICTALPSPDLVAPSLLNDKEAQPRTDCAAAMEDNRQSLLVNSMIAAIAAKYVHTFVMRRSITTFETVVDLTTLSMRSTPITAANIAAALGDAISIDHLVHSVAEQVATSAAMPAYHNTALMF